MSNVFYMFRMANRLHLVLYVMASVRDVKRGFKIETGFKTEYSKSIFQNRNSISHFLFFSVQYMQKSKQINKPIYANWRDVRISGSLV